MSRLKEHSEGWISHDEVGRELLQITGVSVGVEQQQQIFLLGEMLRDLRERFMKVSQTEAAKIIGMPQPELSRIESGVGSRGPSITTVLNIVNNYERHLAPKGIEIGFALDVDVRGGDSMHYKLAGAEVNEG